MLCGVTGSCGVGRVFGGGEYVRCDGVGLVVRGLYGKALDAKALVMFGRAFRA